MLSPEAPPSLSSPGLSDSSAQFDQYFDIDSLLGPSTYGSEKPLLIADEIEGLQPLLGESAPMDMGSDHLYNLLMGQPMDKQLFERAVEVPSMETCSSVDPLTLQAPTPGSLVLKEETAEEELDDDMDQDEDDYVDSDEEGPKTRSSSKRNSRSKSSKKSVAALALPMHEGQANSSASAIHGKLPHMSFAVPDYIDRPSPEAYKKMSSREKRQLRNKISARNFRHRRKEYITELEEKVAMRDETIVALQSEIGAVKEENRSLKKDVDLLRKQFEDAMARFGSSSSLTTGPSDVVGAAPLQASTNSPRRGRSLVVPNINKDVSLSSTWGPGGFSGVTRNLGVHHTILPERHPDLSGKLRHLNPLLDNYDAMALPAATSHLRNEDQPDLHDDFFETNPYLLNSTATDAYRGQLYDKIFHNARGWSQGQKSFPADFRPAFFTSPGAVLSGKPSTSTLSAADVERREAAYVAGHASTTLFRKMASAFAEAFAGPKATSQVADLLAGRAHVRIVPSIQQSGKTATEEVAERLAELRVNGGAEVLKSEASS